MASIAEIQAFQRDGAVCLRNVVDAGWRARLEAAIERDIAEPGPYYHGYESGGFHGNLRTWQKDPDFRAYCFSSPLPELAAALLGAAKVNLLYDQLFVKEPGMEKPTRWHNDQPYWPVSGRDVISFWTCLDSVSADSGAMQFIQGSHLWQRWFQPEPFDVGGTEYEANADYEKIPDFEAERAAHEILSWDMVPGDVVAFTGMTVHYAGGNFRTDQRRRGYVARYTGDDARYSTRPGTSPMLRDPSLADGAPMDSETYPVVWRA